MLGAAVETAEKIGQPQCIVIVDASDELLGEIRMIGAKFLSRKSAHAKARTAASTGAPSTDIPEAVRPHIAVATGGGAVTGLAGRSGLTACCTSGVGSGSPEQDLAVARAALEVIGAETDKAPKCGR